MKSYTNVDRWEALYSVALGVALVVSQLLMEDPPQMCLLLSASSTYTIAKAVTAVAKVENQIAMDTMPLGRSLNDAKPRVSDRLIRSKTRSPCYYPPNLSRITRLLLHHGYVVE